MSATETPTTTGTEADDLWTAASLLAIECNLRDLDAAARLLGHLSTSELTIGTAELNAIAAQVSAAHIEIKQRWRQAYEQQFAERQAHEAALAEAKAARAAPGSVADVEKAAAYWNKLRSAAVVTIESCDKAEARP
jgi:hypothetical protein